MWVWHHSVDEWQNFWVLTVVVHRVLHQLENWIFWLLQLFQLNHCRVFTVLCTSIVSVVQSTETLTNIAWLSVRQRPRFPRSFQIREHLVHLVSFTCCAVASSPHRSTTARDRSTIVWTSSTIQARTWTARVGYKVSAQHGTCEDSPQQVVLWISYISNKARLE